MSDLFAKATILKFGQKLVVGEVTIYSGTVENSVAQAMMTYARPLKIDFSKNKEKLYNLLLT